MTTNLTGEDIAFLLESLEYTKLKFESTEYPTYEFKREQIARVESVITKLRAIRGEIAEN